MEKENEEVNVQKLIEKLGKKYNKKEKTIRCMVKLLQKENYNLIEIEELIIEFMGR